MAIHAPGCPRLVQGGACGCIDPVDLLRDIEGWLGRASEFVNAVVVMAENKTPGLALIADMALWNDRRKEALDQWRLK